MSSGRQGEREEECVVSQNPFGKVIAAYSREEAIRDKLLVDVSVMAHQAGIRYPTCLTRAVWDRYVEVPESVSGIQDADARLWDILWMFCYGCAESEDSSELLFKLHVANEPGPPKPVTLKAVCSPGDTPDPVLTIMRPEGED